MDDLSNTGIILFAIGSMLGATVISFAGWELAYLITRAVRRHK